MSRAVSDATKVSVRTADAQWKKGNAKLKTHTPVQDGRHEQF